MRKATAYSVIRSRGNRDKLGRRIRNRAAYVSGMQRKAAGYSGRSRFTRTRRSYRYRRY